MPVADQLSPTERILADAMADPDDVPVTRWATESEAIVIADRLWTAGYEIVERSRTPLPSSAPVRNGSPSTSRIAAASISDLTKRQRATFEAVIAFGPCTDGDLVTAYQRLSSTRGWPRQTPASLRTRRAELVRGGHVAATADLGQSPNRRPAHIWGVVYS